MTKTTNTSHSRSSPALGEIIDTSYVYTPSPTELNDSSTKEIEVILRATDSRGAFADKILKIIIVRSPLVSKIPDSYRTVGQELTIDISTYIELNPDEMLSMLSGPGLLNDNTYTFTPLQLPVHTQSHSVYTTALYSPHCNNSTSTYSNIHSKST